MALRTRARGAGLNRVSDKTEKNRVLTGMKEREGKGRDNTHVSGGSPRRTVQTRKEDSATIQAFQEADKRTKATD